MNGGITFEVMQARLRVESGLPQVPMAALRLGELVDQELISQEVIRTTASDPALTANLLRSASSPLYALSPKPITDVRSALSILGVRGVKSVAMSVLMQSVASGLNRSSLDSQRFIQHSTFVGIMAKYIFMRRRQIQPFATSLGGDELFAAGILHDLGKGVLAYSFPAVLDSLVRESKMRQISVEKLFADLYGQPLYLLTLTAFQSWKLPNLFSVLVEGMHTLNSEGQEINACAALDYANYLACANGFGEFPDSVVVEPSEFTLELASLVPEEMPTAISQVVAHTNSCLIRPRAA